MRISKVLLLLLLALAPVVAFATGQEDDIIYIDGQQWGLMGRPVTDDSTLYANLRALLPEDRVISTANYDGFTCYWSLNGDWLVLDSVGYRIYNEKASFCDEDYFIGESLSREALHEVFKDYFRDGKIVATWVTDTLRTERGELIRYVHMGWDRDCEMEMFLEVKEGHVDKRTLYHNRVVVDGFDVDRCTPEQWREFKDGFLPVLRKYHELDSVKECYFEVGRCVVDSLGNLLDAEVKIQYKGKRKEYFDLMIEWFERSEDGLSESEQEEIMERLAQVKREMEMDELPPLSLEFKQYLMSKRPWKVLYINGKYYTSLQENSIPFTPNGEE